MKTLTLLIVLALFIQFTVSAQSCLPDGITFSTQEEIDNFPTDYPNCTQIEGDVYINGVDIINLNGLSVMASIGGDLSIGYYSDIPGPSGVENPLLTNLIGLGGLTSIGGNLSISSNAALTNLSGLDALTTIAGSLYILKNGALTSLSGLDNLIAIGGNLKIGDVYCAGWNGNPNLTSLTGLEGLTSIGGYLNINSSYVLTNLSGLDNVVSIGGYLSIIGNLALASLTGLDNVTSIAGDLVIGFSYEPPFAGGGNPALTSLTGLGNVTSIGGGFGIMNNYALTSLAGPVNLTSIGGDVYISSYSLTSLSGLDNVASIGGYLSIDGNSLTNISALGNVTTIGGYLSIQSNYDLTSLIGIDNIDAGSIEELYIINNSFLSTCEVQSICNYLASPNGSIEIHDNAPGCNSQEEVEQACDSINGVVINRAENYSIYPNPLEGILTFSSEEITYIEIYDMMGALIASSKSNKVDMSNMPSGIYFAVGFDKNLYPLYKGKIIKK